MQNQKLKRTVNFKLISFVNCRSISRGLLSCSSGVFGDGFARLPFHARYLDGFALLIVAVTLLTTPETQGSAPLSEAWRSCYSLVSGRSLQPSFGCGVTNSITAFASRRDAQDVP